MVGKEVAMHHEGGIILVLLSFNFFEQKLKARTKDQTVRLYTPARFRQLSDAEELQCWWKSRTPDGYKLYNAIHKELPIVVRFMLNRDNGGSRAQFSIVQLTTPECITDGGYWENNSKIWNYTGSLRRLTLGEADLLAARDGFPDLVSMILFFVHMHGPGEVFCAPWIVTRFEARSGDRGSG